MTGKSKSEIGLQFTAGQLASWVCQLEVTASKPGNVHRGADFEDVTLGDFLSSGIALGSAIDAQPPSGGAGSMILSAIERTSLVTRTNTNLGMVLLICPLAKLVQRAESITPQSIAAQIDAITGAESQAVYQAIAKARAGGMSQVERHDVNTEGAAPERIMDAMEIAKERDMVAKQYCCGYTDVIEFVLPGIEEGLLRFGKISHGIVWAHVKTMARFPDSLISRKLGDAAARKASAMAAQCLEQLTNADDDNFWRSVGDLDFWLRSDGHRRNPGTTADLIAAALYVGLVNNCFKMPLD
jgi:triphosphoribosyl-dephospho-CoA synthase